MSDSDESDNWFDKDIEEFKAPIKPKVTEDTEKVSKIDSQEATGGSKSVPRIPIRPPQDYGGSYNIPLPPKRKDKNPNQSTKHHDHSNTTNQKMFKRELFELAEMNPLDIFMEISSKFENFRETTLDEKKSHEIVIILIKILGKLHQVPLNYHVELIMDQIIKPSDILRQNILDYVTYAADLEDKNTPNLLPHADQVWNDLETICKYGLKYREDQNHWENLAKAIFEVLQVKTRSSLLEKCTIFGKIIEDIKNNYFYPAKICGTLQEINEKKDLSSPEIKDGKYNSTKEYLEHHLSHLKSYFMTKLCSGVQKLRLLKKPLGPDVIVKRFDGTNFFRCVRIRKSFPQFMSFRDKYFLLDLFPHTRVDDRKVPTDIRRKINYGRLHLTNGSLLFLSTSSAFENIIVAEIPYLPDEIQEQGFVIVDILHMENIEDCIFNRDLVLMTIPMAFEPIYQNLKALNKFSTKTLPMKEYFVYCQSSAAIPDYENLEEYTLSLDKVDIRAGRYKEDDLRKLGMNEKQFEAFQLALTRKLSLIQGPPGTGKTSLALNIVQRLLTNTSLRILIVTYRNLALDKFLLACSKLTDKIVRLGQQFADPEVKKFAPDRGVVDPRYQGIHGKTHKDYMKTVEKFVDNMMCYGGATKDTSGTIKEHLKKLRKATTRLNQLASLRMYFTCRDARIIGMTTSGVARNRELLELLRPSVVIMEEAAEVPETHIITTLTEYTQQLILIGDHKQLSHGFDVESAKDLDGSGKRSSLFERLITNGVNNVCLNVQYRMHPDIADLVRPLIYKDLNDGYNVKEYKPVKGVRRNLFCVSHENLETLAEERYKLLNKEFPTENFPSTSKENFYEMLFAVGLANYLRQQGYESHEVVILTTYSGQQVAIASILLEFPWLKNVEVHTVDSFQGQESRIVILSVVRSNESRNIGFLTSEQRLCVLLTRAQEGFYIIGNMDLLVEKSEAWKDIRQKLENKKAIGPGLPIKCEKHNSDWIATGMEDFLKFTRDGCPVGEILSENSGNICLKKKNLKK